MLQYLTRGLARIAQNDTHHLHRLFLKDSVALIYNLLERRRGCWKVLKKEEELTNQKYFIENCIEELPLERMVYLD